MNSKPAQEAQRFDYYHSDQASQEAEMVRKRREELPPQGRSRHADDRTTVAESQGLALSGGGIRSATFNLGLLQSLAADGQLKDFDFLSTVSGGGYIGACLGRLYQRSAHEQARQAGPSAEQTASDVERVLASDEAPLIRWLRDHGRYLAPQGLQDRLFAFGIYLRNMLTVHLLLGMMLLFAFLLWGGMRLGLLLSLGALCPDCELIQPLTRGEYSPAWLLVAVALMATLGCVWAYWMHRHDPIAGKVQRWIALVVFIGSAAVIFLQEKVGLPAGLVLPAWLLWTLAIAAPFALLLSFLAGLKTGPGTVNPPASEGRPGTAGAARRAAIRSRLTIWLRETLLILLGLVLLALLDEATQRTYAWLGSDSRLSGSLLLGGGLGGALLAGLRAFAQGMAASQAGRRGSAATSRWVKPAINALGIALLGLVACFWSLLAVAYLDLAPAGATKEWLPVARHALPALMTLGLLVWLSNQYLDLLNLSSLHHFYAARLTRAYLGAGNPARGVPWSAQPAKGRLRRVDEVVRGDDMRWDDYRPHEHGGPLHLVNVNVNQTRFFTDSDFQPDRQGWNLAIGPAGFNLGRSVWQPKDWKDKKDLRLGHWVAVSGAAFTTGAGARTGLGFSALLGLLGVRLGYWWRAGEAAPDSPRQKPRLLQALRMLRHEITGRFNPDDDSHWYLSDGGHFENCAAYELIRRRVKRIVVADCGADPQYGFEDLANLALKIRVDFGAELSLLGAHDLDRVWKGQAGLRALFADPGQMQGRNGPGLLLATVRHPDDPVPGWMVIVKPRLPQQLPADLAYYANNETDFPQQSTLDQFYDESQWESTRKLGRLQGEQLAQVLKALPAWQDPAAAAGFAASAAPWSRESAEPADPPAADEPGTSKALKIYAPIFVALWTAFEFHSGYQQQQEKQADELTRFALSRIDKIEGMIESRSDCRETVPSCPQDRKIAAHIGLVRQMMGEHQPSRAGELLRILDMQAEAVNVARRTPAVRDMPAGTEAPEHPVQRPDADLQRALVYLQIYDESGRNQARAVVRRLQQQGLRSEQTPGIENVTRTAEARGLKTVERFGVNTVVYFHAGDRQLAEWTGSQIAPDHPTRYQLRDLSGAFPDVRPGQIEVWLAAP